MAARNSRSNLDGAQPEKRQDAPPQLSRSRSLYHLLFLYQTEILRETCLDLDNDPTIPVDQSLHFLKLPLIFGLKDYERDTLGSL